MAIADKVERYEVYIDQNNFVDYYRSIRLSLESGGTAFIGFPPTSSATSTTYSRARRRSSSLQSTSSASRSEPSTPSSTSARASLRVRGTRTTRRTSLR